VDPSVGLDAVANAEKLLPLSGMKHWSSSQELSHATERVIWTFPCKVGVILDKFESKFNFLCNVKCEFQMLTKFNQNWLSNFGGVI
jgi:hypothetical protein